MIAEDIKADFPIMAASDGQKLSNPLFVAKQFGCDFRGAVANPVQQTIQLSPINKSEINLLPLDGPRQAAEVF